ncbi:hypothetical protein Tco_0525549 [Tanacetum coccineum]
MYHVLPNNTAYSVNSIRRIGIQQIHMAYSHQLNTAYLSTDMCMTRSFTKELFTPLENPKRVFRSRRKLFETPSLVESNSPEFVQFSDIGEHLEEENIENMTETMEQYMSKTRGDHGSGVTRPKINQDAHFELKGKFLKELCDNTFSGSEHEEANEYIKKVLEIVDLFHIPNITQDQIMLRAFPVSLTGATSHWLRNEPAGSILTWEVLKSKTKQPIVVPISTTEPKRTVNQYVAASLKKIVASESTNQKSRSPTRKKYEHIILFIIDSGCLNHMTGNLKLLSNFVEKFLGTVKFINDQIAPILGYEDLVKIMSQSRGFYIKGLNHNLFSVGQFCDAVM